MPKREFPPVAIACTAAATVLGLLALRYPDRAVFSEYPTDIPHRSGLPLIGSLAKLLMSRSRFHDMLQEEYEKADVLTLFFSSLGHPRTIQTIDPQNIDHVLKTNFGNYVKGPMLNDATADFFGHGIFNANGEQWKYQRKTASMVFNTNNFRDHFTEIFVKELSALSSHVLDNAVKHNQPVDFHDLMFRFTLDSFVLLGFGVQLNSVTNKEKSPFVISFDKCQRDIFDKMINPFYGLTDTLSAALMPWKKTYGQHIKTVNEFAADVIKTRREQLANGKEFKDLMSYFMKARNEHGDELNDTELRDVVMNFIIAGRDTTAQALSWTFYCLSQNPQVEAKLLEEIEAHITDGIVDDPPALYEAINRMKYAHAVFFEVLRLFPSVPANQKFALEDDIWPDGSHINKGDYIVWSSYSQGRSEHVWENAKSFLPERWFSETGDLRRESASRWAVFHHGPRVCLGQRLATLEAIVAITLLLRRHKFTVIPGQDITYETSITLPMKNGMKVKVENREKTMQ